jgi:hypothetical protein
MQLKKAPGSSIGKYFFLIFGLLWTCISCGVTVPMIIGFGSPGMLQGDIATTLLGAGFPLLFTSCFILVGLAFIVGGLRPLIAGTRVAEPEVTISSMTLKSGEEFTLDYRQAFKGASDVLKITLQLVLRESATYRRGTDTVTVTHDHIVDSAETPERHFDAGQVYTDRRRWAIPRGAMHSFEATRNRLRWLIKVRVEIKGWPDYDDEYAIQVLPEVAY